MLFVAKKVKKQRAKRSNKKVAHKKLFVDVPLQSKYLGLLLAVVLVVRSAFQHFGPRASGRIAKNAFNSIIDTTEQSECLSSSSLGCGARIKRYKRKRKYGSATLMTNSSRSPFTDIASPHSLCVCFCLRCSRVQNVCLAFTTYWKMTSFDEILGEFHSIFSNSTARLTSEPSPKLKVLKRFQSSRRKDKNLVQTTHLNIFFFSSVFFSYEIRF